MGLSPVSVSSYSEPWIFFLPVTFVLHGYNSSLSCLLHTYNIGTQDIDKKLQGSIAVYHHPPRAIAGRLLL